jgi:ribose 1,5-bisphosphokinase
VPRHVADLRKEGKAVVANVSRSVVAAARDELAPLAVIAIEASAAILEARLGERGRETPAQIRQRLDRVAIAMPADVVVIDNSGTLREGIDRFIEALERLHR